MTIRALQTEDLSPSLQQQASSLFWQLNSQLDPFPLASLLEADNPPVVLACLEGDALLGMACMANYRVLSGHKGWIEDLVVDQKHRGRGIGRELVSSLLAIGQEQGLSEILLFTGEHRIPAIALYESLGFHRKNSRLYSLKLAAGE